MKWNQWPFQLFIPCDKTCLWNEISTVKTFRTAHKLLFAGVNCTQTAHFRSTLHNYCRTLYKYILYNYYSGCFLDNAGARTAHLLANMENAEICSLGAVKDGCEQNGKETKLCNCREIRRCHVRGEGHIFGHLFCSCQVYLQTLAATDKTKDNTATAYFIHVKSFLDVQEAIN